MAKAQIDLMAVGGGAPIKVYSNTSSVPEGTSDNNNKDVL